MKPENLAKTNFLEQGRAKREHLSDTKLKEECTELKAMGTKTETRRTGDEGMELKA